MKTSTLPRCHKCLRKIDGEHVTSSSLIEIQGKLFDLCDFCGYCTHNVRLADYCRSCEREMQALFSI